MTCVDSDGLAEGVSRPTPAHGGESATPADSPPPETPAEDASVGSEPVAEPAPDLILDALGRLAGEIAGIGRRIDELVRLGDRREQLIDRLHAENQRLRAGEVAQVQAPVLREMIRGYDLVVSLQSSDSPANPDLDLVRRRLLDGLEQAGVRPLTLDDGAPFDAAFHSAVERVDTSQPELDMTVERTVRVGFAQDAERLLRPADVAVWRLRDHGAAEALPSEPAP